MRYIPPVLLQFSFLRFSVQLEQRCSPPHHAFASSHLVFPRGIRNYLEISYSDNFLKACHFKVHANNNRELLFFLLKKLRGPEGESRFCLYLLAFHNPPGLLPCMGYIGMYGYKRYGFVQFWSEIHSCLAFSVLFAVPLKCLCKWKPLAVITVEFAVKYSFV